MHCRRETTLMVAVVIGHRGAQRPTWTGDDRLVDRHHPSITRPGPPSHRATGRETGSVSLRIAAPPPHLVVDHPRHATVPLSPRDA